MVIVRRQSVLVHVAEDLLHGSAADGSMEENSFYSVSWNGVTQRGQHQKKTTKSSGLCWPLCSAVLPQHQLGLICNNPTDVIIFDHLIIIMGMNLVQHEKSSCHFKNQFKQSVKSCTVRSFKLKRTKLWQNLIHQAIEAIEAE